MRTVGLGADTKKSKDESQLEKKLKAEVKELKKENAMLSEKVAALEATDKSNSGENKK
ncbi:MAG: hypothetical protein ACI4EX_01805 [Lachnospiraceae bacterium]